MGSCYSADHIAEDHIHTDITCNIEEPQESAVLKRSIIEHFGFTWLFLGVHLAFAGGVLGGVFLCILFPTRRLG